MRRTIIEEDCDQCWQRGDGQIMPAIGSIRLIADGVPLRFDHCAEHKDPSWSVLRELAVRDDEQRPRRGPAPLASASVPCPDCDRVFTTPNALRMHRASHQPPVACPTCGKTFAPGTGLMTHSIRVHGVKPETATAGKRSPSSARRKRSS